MKWKTVYRVYSKPIVIGAMMLAGLNISTALKLKFTPHLTESSVVVNYGPLSDNIGGIYTPKKQEIIINPEFKEDVFFILAHELKHANNAQQFSYRLNINADEMSAQIAGELAGYGLRHRMQHALAKMSPSDLESPMDKLQEKRFNAGTDWNAARQSLLAEKQKLVDSITMQFAGNMRDSLLRIVNERYDEDSESTKKLRQIAENITDSVSYKINLAAIKHDVNYNLPHVEQTQIDDVFLAAMEQYKIVRAGYLRERVLTWLYTQFHPLNDAELEKLFTYKINGVHRSLFKEASPEVQAQVRRMANGDNLVFTAKRALGRE